MSAVWIILIILAVSALLGWFLLLFWKRMENARSPGRRWVIFCCGIYSLKTLMVVAGVAAGEQRPLTLLALPIPLVMAWHFFKQARSLKRIPEVSADK